MRLIDADALIAQWESDAEEMEELAFKLATYGAINDVKHQPTIEPRKKGKWLLHTYMPHNKYCSCCEKDSPYGKLWDFCPNCGADMRKGERNDYLRIPRNWEKHDGKV